MAYHYFLCNHGVGSSGCPDSHSVLCGLPSAREGGTVCRDVLVQHLHRHSGEKFVLSVQAGNGSVLLRSSLTSLLGDQYSSSLHKPCGYVVGITLQHVPHDPPEKLCRLVECLPSVATDSVPSRGLPAIQPFDNLPPDVLQLIK